MFSPLSCGSRCVIKEWLRLLPSQHRRSSARWKFQKYGQPARNAGGGMMGRVTAPTRWPEARATRGMVAAPHALAAEAGRAIFTAGGNALDAAIAAAATIAVVYPHMNSVGGDNFWLIYDARAGRLRALNACGRSAAAVNADDYRTRYGDSMPIRGGS